MAERDGFRRPMNPENGRIFVGKHIHGNFDLHRIASSRRRDKGPASWWSSVEAKKIFAMERTDESIRVYPNSDSLGENMTINGNLRMQVRAEHAVIFRVNSPEVQRQPGHRATPIC